MGPQSFLAAVRRSLLERRTTAGHWEGHLSSSALATATAVTAFAAARRAGVGSIDTSLIDGGVRWLLTHVNPDGAWGDTPDSVSNISTTALVWASLAFGNGPQVEFAAAKAESWIARAAGGEGPERLAAALAARYGKDRTFSVPILTMCAIAGRLGSDATAWRLIPQLPFELAVVPRRFFGTLRLPVVSYALPALISMGLVRHRRGRSSPGLSALRERVASRALAVLTGLQPEGGGFLEAVPLTSFVAMSLVAAGEPQHVVVSNALDFLRRSVRADGSWAIDSNLATWVTTLAVNALADGEGLIVMNGTDRSRIRDWLLAQQWRVEHPYTGAAPGGWAWTDLPGGVPDADDTAGALVALWHLGREDPAVREAAVDGVRWLLDLQNRDGGIPTFCRGWGTLPFDRSSTDLTAHAIRAWTAWRDMLNSRLMDRTDRAIASALAFLTRRQRGDGAFVPLWFGNQAEAREENPVLGTSRVLKGLGALPARSLGDAAPIVERAASWILAAQNDDGGWGAGRAVRSSIEETAAAVTGLTAVRQLGDESGVAAAIERGLSWLEAATRSGMDFPSSPIGLYFARLWYAEELYPIIFTAGALEGAGRTYMDRDRMKTQPAALKDVIRL
jgi:squalene-hopene/tetraprenyl-beta-curcumene cyclase